MAITITRRPQPRRRRPTRSAPEPNARRDGGYTLVELLLVVAILGVLASVAWLGVTGITTEAAETGCLADARQLHVAAGAFFAQTGSEQIAPTGADPDRFERTLVEQGFLTDVSTFHDLTADGQLDQETTPC